MAVLGLQALVLAPAVRTGFVFDDAINSSFTGAVGLERSTFWAVVWDVVRSWIVEAGRFFPTGFYQGYAQFHLIHDLGAYKALIIGFTLLSSAAAYALLRRLGSSAAAAGLAILVATTAIQFRHYHDPVLAYSGLTQIVLTEVLVSAIAFDLWLEHRRRSYLLAAAFLLVLASTTYELAYLLVGVHVVVAWRRTGLRRALRASAVPLAVSASFVALAVVLRVLATSADTSYRPAAGFEPVARTFANQVLGALPLSYVLLDPHRIFPSIGQLATERVAGVDLLVWSLGAVLAFVFVRAAWMAPSRTGLRSSTTAGVGVAAVLLLGAALPISLAPKYQGELRAGLAHIPVLVEYYAVGILVTAAVGTVTRIRRRIVAALVAGAFAIVLGGVGLVQLEANQQVAEQLRPERVERTAVERALHRGLLDTVTDGSDLYTELSRPWATREFFYQHAGKRVRLRVAVPPPVDGGACPPASPAAYALVIEGAGDDRRFHLQCLGPT